MNIRKRSDHREYCNDAFNSMQISEAKRPSCAPAMWEGCAFRLEQTGIYNVVNPFEFNWHCHSILFISILLVLLGIFVYPLSATAVPKAGYTAK